METSEIRGYFHRCVIWLPINIMGDELRSRSWNFVMLILYLSCGSRTPHTQKFTVQIWLKFRIFRLFRKKYLLEYPLMCSFVCFGFLKRLKMPWHLHWFDNSLKLLSPSWHWGVRKVAMAILLFHMWIYTNKRWIFAPKLRSNLSTMILWIETSTNFIFKFILPRDMHCCLPFALYC